MPRTNGRHRPLVPRRPRRALALALAAAALAGACSGGIEESDGAPTPSSAEPDATTTTAGDDTTTTDAPPVVEGDVDGFVPEPLTWEDCGAGTECATLIVPLDWSDIDGDTIEIAVSRAPATGPGERLGMLLYNLGGPGATGVDSVPGGGPFAGSETAERYDIASWDPRGVGQSTALGCGDEVEPFLELDSDPDTPDEQAALDAAAQAVGAECEAEDEPLLSHVGTDDVVRDLEAIRLASGERVVYYGFSYGTAIGLRYAELFPGSPAAIVLDGVVDPEHTQTDLLRGQAVGFERTMQEIFAGCPDGATGCPEGGAAAAYDRLAARVETEPLRTSGGDVGPSELSTAAILVTYDESFWEPFYAGLVAADEDGDGEILRQLTDTYRTLAGFTLYQAVSCTDSVNPQGSEAWAAFAAELEAISPRFGAAIANEMLPCAFWPVAPRPVTGPVDGAGAGPILVIGTTGDAATPIEQAQRVAANLEDGHLLTFDGEGHTAYGSSSCIEDAVDAYLIDGELPAEGTVC